MLGRRKKPAPATPGDASPALIDRARGALSALRVQPAAERPSSSDADLTEMLGQIGTALLAASQATSDIEETLNGLADRYGRGDLRIFVLPTLIMIEDARTAPSQTAIFAASQEALRLDQAD